MQQCDVTATCAPSCALMRPMSIPTPQDSPRPGGSLTVLVACGHSSDTFLNV
jgi:hypothetical protein